ncbi:hypothetical protein GLOTRDRAFT_130976 [Gloeophyllum trabeum ATCC 11539]|uniref:DUF6533 domain-containing protein n=1 Tax=Gloeophyllum trabeum (strain ATCC 11539 / FP-39264 / Madison 617) TaxID=670483 RepID=S7RLS0_GLOTA|nr:uncharacterized protein GLOTRDRAFT_130976 [Gloeophyllum trabeum ATCC 11539]EPQ53639.1 hypothetical protein GLOTRDRAFT_130976 [Gloeophyllum trabeum ATCC 11539]
MKREKHANRHQFAIYVDRQVNRYANFSRLALMIYDIVLNLGREKQLVWDTKFRTYSLLYYMSRYPLVPFQVFEVFYTPSMPQYVVSR